MNNAKLWLVVKPTVGVPLFLTGVAVGSFAVHVAKGAALVVAQAPFNPVGAARHAMRVLDRHPSINAGVANENEYLREQPRVEVGNSILRSHPLFMLNKLAGLKHGTVSGAFGLRTLSPRKARTSAMAGGGFMSKMILPFPLLSRPKDRTSAMRGTWTLSGMFGIPMILRR